MSLAIDRFELRAFGPFTGTVLDLRGSPGSLHLIYGPNEIGKSTTQRAISDFLFGIPVRSGDNQLHGYGEMRLGAVLVDAADRRHELTRRKGNRLTLTGPDGGAVDEGVIAAMLGGMSREEFTAMFSITHESLVLGGEALLSAGGEVGESLFSASLGASGLHRVREALEVEADALYRPQSRKTLVMQSRAALEAAEARLRETTVRASSYEELEQATAATVTRRAEVAAALGAARGDQHARRRVRAVIPLLAQRAVLGDELTSLGGVPRLAADAAERRVRAQEQASQGRAAVADAGSRIDDLEERIATVAESDALLGREAEIQELRGRSLGVRESRDDLARLTDELQLASGLAGHALASVRRDVALADAAELVLDARERGRIEAALEERAGLLARLAGAETEAAAAEQRAAALRAEPEEVEAERAPDTAALELALAEARAAGPLEAQLSAAREARHEAEHALGLAAAALSPASDPDGLAALPCPGAVTVERCTAAQDALAERAAKLVDAREHLEHERRQLVEDRSRLAVDREVPTLEELDFARARRDRDWARIRRHLEGDSTLVISPEKFEQGSRVADAVADSLREHAGLAAQAAELDLRDDRLGQEFAALSRADEALAGESRDAASEWARLWAPTGLTPLGPREMTQWLRDRAIVIERVGALARSQRTADALEDRLSGHRRALGRALKRLGVDGVDAESPLHRLLSLASTTIATAGDRAARALELAREREAAVGTWRRQQVIAESLAGDLRRWEAAWTTLVLASGWPADVAPEEARGLLGALEELDRHLREISQLGLRVKALDGRIGSFDAAATRVVGEVAPELAERAAPEAVDELGRRLDAALERRRRHRSLEAERATAREDLLRARAMTADATAVLGELVALAGVDRPEALEAVEAHAARRDVLASRIPELDAQISAAGQAPLEQIVAMSEGVDIDALDAEIQSEEELMAGLEREQSQLDGRLGELREARETMERAGGAAAAGQAVQQHTAELRELVERYLRIHLAAWALSEAIDRYRRDHKDPLLRRASELFPRLTCGSFTGLEADFDDADEPVLIGVRVAGERIGVAQMSTGTREQLYLALRLASLERHVELHGPMPVILDDVVLHSDPRRKAAILQALADLGRRTQVIAFSHDPQTVALAQAAVEPTLLTVHELGSHEFPHALHPAVGAGDVRPLRQREAA